MENSHGAAQSGYLRFSANRGLSNHLWITLLSILLCILAGRDAQAQPRAKNVLFVFSIVRYSDEMLGVIQPYMRAHCPGPINFYYAYLEDIQSDENPSWESQAEIFRRRYAGVKMDVVIANVAPSLRFAVKYRERIFPGVPIVFVSVNKRELEGQEIGPGVTGVTNPLGFKETIDLALHLHPDTKAIAVIAGATNWDSYWLQPLHSELVRYQDKVKEIDLVGNPNRQMLERINNLPPHTLVIFQMAPQFSDQPDFGTWDLLSEVAQRFPTYSVWPRFCVNGCVGGVFKDPVQEWKMTADLAIRVLSGERPDDIPIVHNSNLRAIVDWRALQRWHLPESALPPGSIVRFREPTLWERGRKYFLAAIAIIFAQTSLILGMFWQRARRRRIENQLAITNDRLLMAVEAGRSAGWDTDIRTGHNRWFGDLRTMFGISGDSNDGHVGDFRKSVHPEDRGMVETEVAEARNKKQPYAADFRVIRTDGETRWLSARGKFYYSVSGEPERMVGMATDVTERKMAEAAIMNLSGQLIQAQEAERSRIAREIHDDYLQRLAVLSIELSDVRKYLERDSEGSQRLRELWDRVGELSSDLHSLSHRLHSSTLDNLGLVPAMISLCAEFGDHHSIEINFVEENVPRNIPKEVALCLFRITQEALQNIKKHSHADSAEVRVEGLEQKIHLSISDRGTGFDQGADSRRTGIGIQSMEERVRLVGGQFAVHSRPMEGTTIDVWVPIDS
jgi:PAS domain S-box-containing protein